MVPAANLVAEKSDGVKIVIDLGKVTSRDQITEARINDVLSEMLKAYADRSELECSVTVKGEVSVGLVSVEISVTVSGPCSEVRAQAGAIANQLMDAVKDALK